jgi:hypothetical protein
MRVVAGIVPILATAVATGHAQPPPAVEPAQPAGDLEATLSADAAGHRGLIFPGGWLRRADSAALDVHVIGIPGGLGAGGATLRISLHDRWELFGRVAMIGLIDLFFDKLVEGGARFQVQRAERHALAIEAGFGRDRGYDHHDTFSPGWFASVGAAGSQCLDAGPCRWVGSLHLAYRHRLGEPGHHDDTPMFDQGLAAAASVVGGRRWKFVGELILTAWEGAHLASYGGLRYARRHLAIDAGLTLTVGSLVLRTDVPVIPLPALTLTGAF